MTGKPSLACKPSNAASKILHQNNRRSSSKIHTPK